MNRAERRRLAREKEKGKNQIEAVYTPFDDGTYVTDPLEAIEASAEGFNIPLKKPNKSCNKCHGRGWIGLKADSGEPIPCTCIFVKETFNRELGTRKTDINKGK